MTTPGNLRRPEASHDQAIDTVLAALRAAQPPAGMERRLLQALQSQAKGPRPEALLRPRLPAFLHMYPYRALAGSAAAALLLVLALAHRHPARHTQTPAISTPPASGGPAAPTLQARSIQPPAKPPSHTRKVVTSSPPQEVLVSFPAPPMPLTEQEKLLLRVVRKPDAVQLAVLNPESRASREEGGKQDFESFFPPPLPQETEQGTTGTKDGDPQ